MELKEIRSVRSLFPALQNSVYLENASTGLVPTYVYQAVNDYQNSRYLTGGDSFWGPDRMDTISMIGRSKQVLAQMLNCDSSEITFGSNTSDILSYFTSNVELPDGCNVVIPENLFLSGKYLWQVREKEGLKIRYVPVRDGRIDEEELLAMTDENTLAVHVDLVCSGTGYRIDAERIGEYCRAHGIWFLVDAAQALGALQVNSRALKADLIAGNNYKWMQGYCGCGFGFIRKELQDSLKQRAAGWMSDQYRFVQDSERIQLRGDAERFVLGYPNVAGIYALSLVAEKYLELGGEKIEQYLLHLRTYLEERLKTVSGVDSKYAFRGKNRSQIVYLNAFAAESLSHECLQREGLFCDVHERDEKNETELRIGLHYYNNEEDIDRAIAILQKVIGGKANE